MAGAKSKSGRKSSGGGRKASSKRGGRKTSASARSKAGASRKRAAKRAGSKTGRKTSARKGGRKTAARKTSRRTAGARVRATRSTARKTGRSSAQRGRKSRASQILQSRSDESTAGGGQLEGEGSYTASRHFRGAQTGFVNRNRRNIAKMGRDAEAALEGPEGNELRAAENEARSHTAGED